MLDTLQHIISDLTPYLHQYGYFILALAIAVEGVGIPAPGQSFLIVSGILAAGGQMSLPGVLLVAGLSAFSGNCIGYIIGLRFGDVLLKKGWVKPQTERRLHGFIERYGMIALLLSRFIEGLKQTMCIGCGIAKLPLKTFLLGNLLATVSWVLLFGVGPAILRREMTPLLTFYHSHQLLMWAIGTLVVLGGAVAIWLWQKKR